MDNDKINELMATKVMGAKWDDSLNCLMWPSVAHPQHPDIEPYVESYLPNDDYIFSPITDMNQAMQCADEYKGNFVSICNTPMGWSVFCGQDNIAVCDEFADVPKAICTMILKDMGIKI